MTFAVFQKARIRRMLDSPWVFGEAGLEPEMIKKIKEVLEKDE